MLNILISQSAISLWNLLILRRGHVLIMNVDIISRLQRIRANVNSTEQKRLLMDLDVSMRVSDCPYTVHFYGALFREVCCFCFCLTNGCIIN